MSRTLNRLGGDHAIVQPLRSVPQGLLNAVLCSLDAVEHLAHFDHRMRILRTVRKALQGRQEGTLSESAAIELIERVVHEERTRFR
jgi:hypothetical protein